MKLVGIAKYLYEIEHFKQVKRADWWIIGVKDPESAAEHLYRTAIIGYVLASLKGADPEKPVSVCFMIHLKRELETPAGLQSAT